MSSRLLTGVPRSPPRWVALISRASEAQPLPVRASRVTRGRRGSTLIPPRAGDLRAGAPFNAGWAAGRTAKSTPKTGRIPALRQALTNFTAP